MNIKINCCNKKLKKYGLYQLGIRKEMFLELYESGEEWGVIYIKFNGDYLVTTDEVLSKISNYS